MATTTNFGWETPDDTDLVKDGALAMRTLGNSIDSSFVDLKGGTTGQVLAKASNTDLDYSWVTQDDANAIQNTIVDAKGDLISASAADVPARLAVGNNGDTLLADSATSTGLRWQAPKTQNGAYNSGFDIWQRGTSFTANAGVAYTADRWVSWATTAGQSIYNNRQSVGNLSVSPNLAVQYCMRQGRTSGNTNTGAQRLFQTLESADSYRFAGKTVTLSFYARAGSGFTGVALTSFVTTGTGTDQIYYSFTGSTETTQNNAITTSWQRFSQTVTLGTSTTEVAFGFYFLGVGTAGANDYFEVTGVQFEEGSVATPYSRMSGTLAGELAACQRYFEKSYDLATALGTGTLTGAIFSSGSAAANTTGFIGTGVVFKVTKRGTPILTIYDNSGNSGKCTRVTYGTGLSSNQAVATGNIGTNGFLVESSGTSNNSAIIIHYVADSEL